MNIILVGDFYCGLGVSKLISEGSFDALFGEIKPIVKNADFSIVNFEFPIIIEEGQPIIKYGPNLKGQINAINALKHSGFNVCTLANNHILDQGAQCCLDTKYCVERAGIKTVGVGKNIDEAADILYLKSKEKMLAIVNCCEHEFSTADIKSVGANPLNPIKQFYKIKEAKNKADYVIVVVHGGHEFFQLPSLRMVETYRFFVDAGADAVVNHHQHCYSGYEIYNNRPIFYGLGNFLFDSTIKRNASWHEGFMLELLLENDKIGFNLHPYIQCKDKPTISLMEGKEKHEFFNRIEQLNNIIANDEVLRSELTKYYLSDETNAMKVFEPYSGRLLNKLYYMNLLPRFCTKRRAVALLNYIQCESHRDKIISILKHKI